MGLENFKRDKDSPKTFKFKGEEESISNFRGSTQSNNSNYRFQRICDKFKEDTRLSKPGFKKGFQKLMKSWEDGEQTEPPNIDETEE